MNTTASTRPVKTPDGVYVPYARSFFAGTALTSGSSTLGDVIRTHDASIVHLTAHAKALSGTVSFTVVTGGTSDPSNHVQSTSGILQQTVGSTTSRRHTYGPLDRFTRVSVSVSTDAGAGSTGFFIDGELQ